jgi:hypothetical protein
VHDLAVEVDPGTLPGAGKPHKPRHQVCGYDLLAGGGCTIRAGSAAVLNPGELVISPNHFARRAVHRKGPDPATLKRLAATGDLLAPRQLGEQVDQLLRQPGPNPLRSRHPRDLWL